MLLYPCLTTHTERAYTMKPFIRRYFTKRGWQDRRLVQTVIRWSEAQLFLPAMGQHLHLMPGERGYPLGAHDCFVRAIQLNGATGLEVKPPQMKEPIATIVLDKSTGMHLQTVWR